MAEQKPIRLAPERLKGSWDKLTRAQGHVEDLRRAILAACDGKPPPRILATRREFDRQNNLVLWIADRIPEVGDDWGLMIGDAIHNMRCALDHLWWQLAIDHLGRKPTEDEARDIMFPILTHLDPQRFRGHRYLKHVCGEAAEKAERFQRYDAGEDAVLLLTVLATLSNRDKHREIQPSFFVSNRAYIPLHDPAGNVFVDCELISEIRGGMRHFEGQIVHPPPKPAVGDVVAGISVRPTGPSPDIKVDAQVTGDIVLGSDGNLTFPILNELGQFISGTLNWFAPLLRPPDA